MSLLNRESRLRTIVDADLLRDDELAEYEELNKARFTAKDRSLFVLECVAFPVLLVVFAVLSYRLRDDPQDLGSLFDLLALAVLVVGPFLIMAKWNDACARAAQEREERLTAFKRRLPGYSYRRPRSQLPVRRGVIEYVHLKESEKARFSEINKVERAAEDKARTALSLAGWIALTLLAVTTTTLLPYGAAPSVIIFLLGWIPAAVFHHFGLSKAVKARDARVRAFADSIGYASRFQPSEGGGGGGAGSVSHRWMEHEWYGGHSELNYTDRLRGEMYGMDVETYISNVAEHDKD